MDRKLKISLGIFSVITVVWATLIIRPWIKSSRLQAESLPEVAKNAPRAQPRVTANGSLLSSADPEREIARAKDRRRGRSPAFDSDATRELDFAKLARNFIEKNDLRAEYDRLGEFFPSGKGVNQSIRLSILLSNRSTEGENAFAEIELASRVQAELHANAEATLVSLDQGLAKLPREMTKERFVAIRLLSNLAVIDPSLRDETKSALLAEAQRSRSQSEGALVFAALLRVNPSKEWFQEISRSFERLHPGTELSEFVSTNVVAL